MNTPSDSVALRTSGSDATPLHCTHADCGAFHRNGGFAGASAAIQFSVMPVAPPIARLWMSVSASMRPGPLGVACAASRVMYWLTTAVASSSSARSSARAFSPEIFMRVAVRSNFAASRWVAARALFSPEM